MMLGGLLSGQLGGQFGGGRVYMFGPGGESAGANRCVCASLTH